MRHQVADEPSFREVAEALSLGVPFRLRLAADDRPVQFLHLGSACEAVLGLAPEALLTDSGALSQLVLPEDRARLLAERAQASAGGGPTSTEVRIRRASGELRWLRLTSARRPSGDGAALLDGLIVDITESKRLAEQLAEERHRLEQALELSGMGVFHWDRDDPDTVLWSDRQYAIYGVPPQTPMTRRSYRELVHPDDRLSAHAAVADLQERSGEISVEHRIVRLDGEVRWVQLRIRSQHDAAGLKCMHGATLDVTERRSADEWRRLQMRELAHRAKNAMTVMIAMVRQAARASATVDELKELITSRLLAMARSQELATASLGGSLRLSEVTAQVLEAFDPSRFDLDPRLSEVVIPGEGLMALALLLHELATNAVKYGGLSTPEGRVALSLSAQRDGRAVVEWRERGGPEVKPPTRQGFGTRLIAGVLQIHGGAATPHFAPEGFFAEIELPLA